MTDAGRRFLPCAEIVLSTILQARTIAASDSTPLGILRIGSSESLFTYRVPRVLSEFRKRYPAVELSFALFLHDGLLHSIDSGRLDLAIYMVAALGDDRIKSLRLRTEKMLFIAGPKDLLATKRRVQPTDLTTETLLITESGCAYRRVLVQMLSKMNVRPTKTIEFSSVGAIKECAALGMGIALLPAVVVVDHLARKRLKTHRWAGPRMDISTYILWHKDKWISPAMGTFIAVLREMLSESRSGNHDSRVGEAQF